VATQASLYVAGFLICYVPSLTLRIMEGSTYYDAEDEHTIFPLLVLQALLLPLQGLFNCLIYVRPSYTRSRHQYPEENMLWTFRRALLGDRIKPTNSSVMQSSRIPSSTGGRDPREEDKTPVAATTPVLPVIVDNSSDLTQRRSSDDNVPPLAVLPEFTTGMDTSFYDESRGTDEKEMTQLPDASFHDEGEPKDMEKASSFHTESSGTEQREIEKDSPFHDESSGTDQNETDKADVTMEERD